MRFSNLEVTLTIAQVNRYVDEVVNGSTCEAYVIHI